MQTSTPGKNKKLVLQELQFKVAVRERNILQDGKFHWFSNSFGDKKVQVVRVKHFL